MKRINFKKNTHTHTHKIKFQSIEIKKATKLKKKIIKFYVLHQEILKNDKL